MQGNGRRRVSRRHAGFTLLELLIVVAIIGILVNIAVPALRYALLRSRAVAIVGDFHVIEVAAQRYYIDTGGFPPQGAVGKEPKQLQAYLQGKVNWNKGKSVYRLRWENWTKPNNSKCKHPKANVRYGISIISTDADLVATLSKISPKPFVYSLADTYTYVITPCK
jgi:prepilin-type N-terminal cleavage/methylation domain-containing protein